MSHNVAHLIDQKFGHLLVIERAGNDKYKKALWKCQCDCGNQVLLTTNRLRRGNDTSCGCKKKERISCLNRKHSMSDTRIYIIWKHMKSRCFNPNNKDYLNYGGRGITVCGRWLEKDLGFINFLEDMGSCPPNYTLERKKNNDNYCPENCRWATRKEQALNTRHNVRFEFDGVDLTIGEWQKRLQVSYEFISRKLKKGISFPEIVKQARIYRATKHWHEDLLESAA